MNREINKRNGYRNNELQSVFNHCPNKHIQVYTNKDEDFDQNLIYQLLNNTIYSESPDGLLIFNNQPFIVEHFSIDCSKDTGKGSEFRMHERYPYLLK